METQLDGVREMGLLDRLRKSMSILCNETREQNVIACYDRRKLVRTRDIKRVKANESS